MNTTAATLSRNGRSPASKKRAPARAKGGSKEYKASIYSSCGNTDRLPAEFVEGILGVEKATGAHVWFLVQPHNNLTSFRDEISPYYSNQFFKARAELASDGPIVLVLHSPGGQGDCAYRISRLLQRECGNFTAIIPRRAKSAATLLALGAREIIFGPHAELGPLDAQLVDHDREQWQSALDEVKTLDVLYAASLEAVDQLTLSLMIRTGKKLETLLPAALHFIAETNKPLLDKLDIVRYTQMSRILREAKEYADRLLARNYRQDVAKHIATTLVESYPTHGFMIDYEEAKSIKIRCKEAEGDLLLAIDKLVNTLESPFWAVGRLQEMPRE